MAYVREEWWYTDEQGRRIGWMWPEEFSAILAGVYGDRAWVLTFAGVFGFARATIDRWKKGETPIPKSVAQIVWMLSALADKDHVVADLKAPWLPEGEGANSYKGM